MTVRRYFDGPNRRGSHNRACDRDDLVAAVGRKSASQPCADIKQFIAWAIIV